MKELIKWCCYQHHKSNIPLEMKSGSLPTSVLSMYIFSMSAESVAMLSKMIAPFERRNLSEKEEEELNFSVV